MKKSLVVVFSILMLSFIVLLLAVPADLVFSQERSEDEPVFENSGELDLPQASGNISPPVFLVVDENPAMQNIRFPRTAEIEAAIDGVRDIRTIFDITYLPAGSKDPWNTTCDTFPTNAKTAFNAAAAIWASTIQSSVPIVISACWSDELSPGVLGYSGGGYWWRNFSGAPSSNVWYQSALANAYAGFDLDGSRADMYITYSSSFNWYTGTDGNTPSREYDLVSVAAHEIAHGLNFAGWMNYSGGSALYGYNGYPSIYENFLESLNGSKLTSYSNPSTALGSLVTSNNLWWDGPNANAANGGSRVKIYAPSSWSPGSSYSHLDYSTFSGTANSLMVYAIGSGSSQHNPGPVTKGILKDMGWTIQGTPEAVSGISASDGTFSDRIVVSWNASIGATSYKIFKNTQNSHAGEVLLTDTQVSSPYDDTTALPETDYYYWVQACNNGDCSDYSISDTGWRDEIIFDLFIFVPLVVK